MSLLNSATTMAILIFLKWFYFTYIFLIWDDSTKWILNFLEYYVSLSTDKYPPVSESSISQITTAGIIFACSIYLIDSSVLLDLFFSILFLTISICTLTAAPNFLANSSVPSLSILEHSSDMAVIVRALSLSVIPLTVSI